MIYHVGIYNDSYSPSPTCRRGELRRGLYFSISRKRGVIIDFGEEGGKMMKKSEFGPKLYKFRRIRTIMKNCGNSKKNFIR